MDQIQTKKAGRKLDLFPTEEPEPGVKAGPEELDSEILQADENEDDSEPDDTNVQIQRLGFNAEEKVNLQKYDHSIINDVLLAFDRHRINCSSRKFNYFTIIAAH